MCDIKSSRISEQFNENAVMKNQYRRKRKVTKLRTWLFLQIHEIYRNIISDLIKGHVEEARIQKNVKHPQIRDNISNLVIYICSPHTHLRGVGRSSLCILM